jgi:hypothetical protein
VLLDIGQILTRGAPVFGNLSSAYSKPSCAEGKYLSGIRVGSPVVGSGCNHPLCKSTGCAKRSASLIEAEGLRINRRLVTYQP